MASDNEPDTNDRRRQIIEAALRVFAIKGFHKATNRDIAEEAGISAGLIYWYFKDKEDLFFSILRERAPIFRLIEHPEALMDLPPRAGLALVGRTYLSIFHEPDNVAFLRIILSEVPRFPEIAEIFYRRLGIQFFGLITTYLQHQVEQGALKPHDILTAARAFLGMFVVQVLARELLRQPEALATTDEQIIATVVDIFVSGLEQTKGAANALTSVADHS
jgi:AcrR family transcriptional regulator